jgi:dynein heavy chain 1, cytosolic
MTRWVRGINEALKSLSSLSLNELVRLWAHEALRLFHDRLIGDDEKEWTEKSIDEIAQRNFSSIDAELALKRPIFYSDWLSGAYESVEEAALRDFINKKLKVITSFLYYMYSTVLIINTPMIIYIILLIH